MECTAWVRNGFTFQIALADTESFSGNTTIYPGTHVPVQKALMADPNRAITQANESLTGPVESYEFVAKAGDVLFMHPTLSTTRATPHMPRTENRVSVCTPNRSARSGQRRSIRTRSP